MPALYRLADQLHFNSDRFASDQAIGSLSGGEALKVQLLHELCCPHELLFLDEPSNDLDLETLDWLQQMIQTSPQTILFISHHEDFFDSDGGYDHSPQTDQTPQGRLKPL